MKILVEPAAAGILSDPQYASDHVVIKDSIAIGLISRAYQQIRILIPFVKIGKAMETSGLSCVIHEEVITVFGNAPGSTKSSEEPFYTDMCICRFYLIGGGPGLITVEKSPFR